VRRSTNRLRTSHAGALWRPDDLQALFEAGDERAEEFAAALPGAVADVVRRQAEVGVDCVNDGEFSRRGGYSGYASERLSGLERRAFAPGEGPAARHPAGRDVREFPGFFATGKGEVGIRRGSNPNANPILATGPIGYVGRDAVEADIHHLTMAAAQVDGVEPFMTAVTPGTIEHWLHDDHYGSDVAFMFAIADAMHEEYKAIVDAGIVLQLDDPDLADGWQIQTGMDLQEYRRYAELRVDALNHALRDIPSDRVRLHVCWGSGHGPHKNDLPLREIVDLVLKVRVQCYMLEAANPRHEHEWELWQEVELPDGKLLMPGVVGHVSDIVEHPELVAQRLVRYADAVGRENVIAGTDCGLGYRVGHPEIMWAKLAALSAGADLASRRLWGARV
jgi:5-methyltetrahydropteroyltriglutamate--homocysteine methyltransferase